jgi:hypothetical protein
MKEKLFGLTAVMTLLLSSGVVLARDRSRYSCGSFGCFGYIELCDKDTTTWQCKSGWGNPSGSVQVQNYFANPFWGSGNLRLRIKGYRLPNGEYQITLNGPGGTPTDDLLASACPNPNSGAVWECGYWGSQGFYNIEMNAVARGGCLTVSKDYYDKLPPGHYEGVKIIIKHANNPWTAVLMEKSTPMEFFI